MKKDPFERLANALDKLPNGFPRTPARVEILILKKLFSEADASLASELTGRYEPVNTLAQRLGFAEDELKARLLDLVKQGYVRLSRQGAKLAFRLAPFIVGIYESSLDKMDHELAHLVEEYLDQGGAEGIMKPQPALHRVVPAQGTVKSEWILPYDDIKAMFDKAKSFSVRDCICRLQQDMLKSRRCSFSIKNCVSFSPVERPKRPNDITKDEASAILDEAERVGLVHCVSNVIKDVFYVCNCCGCCCGVLRGITDWGIEESVARANYRAQVNPDECTGCGVCAERCQVKAIALEQDIAAVAPGKCIGCGLCVSSCPVEAVVLERKPDAELTHPPDDFEAWEKRRLENRGLVSK